MRNLVAQLLTNGISRRDFVRRLVATGVTTAAANSVLESVTALAQSPGAPALPEAIRLFTGTGGEYFAEQFIASGVKYIFGNSASEDAHFYEALVDRPQLQYILTPHEGPGAAMAAGYVKASGQPSIVMEAAVVGLTNALGQMFNAWKEQTPLVFYSYRTEESLAAGRDGFEELPGQEQLTEPMTKLTWSARRRSRSPKVPAKRSSRGSASSATRRACGARFGRIGRRGRACSTGWWAAARSGPRPRSTRWPTSWRKPEGPGKAQSPSPKPNAQCPSHVGRPSTGRR